MAFPALVVYATWQEYLDHYKREYCRSTVITHDGIRVYFTEQRFQHAFWRISRHKGPKDTFDPKRAERIDWIKAVLISTEALLLQGWNNYTKSYEPERRVSILVDDYIVVVEMCFGRNGELRANFVTAFVAADEKTQGKVQTAPPWNKEICIMALKKKTAPGGAV